MGKLDILKLLVDDLAQEKSVCGDVFISVNGKIVHNAHYGKRKTACYKISCACEFFVVLTVLRLISNRRLHFYDKLSEFFSYCKHSDMITVEMLLRHTGGLADYTLVGKEIDFFDAIAVSDAIADFPLDKRNKRSATNTVFLCKIAEKISGKSIANCILDEVFKPLGISAEASGRSLRVTSEDIIKLMQSVCEGVGITKTVQKKMLSFDGDGRGIGLHNDNGVITIEIDCDCTNAAFYFSLQDKFCFLHTVRKADHTTSTEVFRREICDVLQVLTVYPMNPVLERYSAHNAARAVKIAPENYQNEFVCDSAHALAYAYANSGNRKSFVLRDGLRVVGIAVIKADLKNRRFGIDMLMIDKRCQCKGYGRILLREVLYYLSRMRVDRVEIAVNRNNFGAIRLYESEGFKKVLAQEDYFVLERQMQDMSTENTQV